RPVVDQLLALHAPLARALGALDVDRERAEVAQVVGDAVGEYPPRLGVQLAGPGELRGEALRQRAPRQGGLGHPRLSASGPGRTAQPEYRIRPPRPPGKAPPVPPAAPIPAVTTAQSANFVQPAVLCLHIFCAPRT